MAKLPVVKVSEETPIVVGDTFEEYSFTIEDTEIVGETMSECRINFINDITAEELLLVSPTDITINSGLKKVTINRIDRLSLPAGSNNGQVEITYSGGTRRTYFVLQIKLVENKTV